MKAIFVNGWGVSEASARAELELRFRFDELKIVQPVEGAIDQILTCREGYDTLIGYSTGAFLLLEHPQLKKAFTRTVLLAPFLDLKVEANLGGRVRQAQLKYLYRWLGKDPLKALEDFYQRAGLRSEGLDGLPLLLPDLLWGVERLLKDSRKLEDLEGWTCFVGGEDRLIDSDRLKVLYPKLDVILGGTHALGSLLQGVEERDALRG